MVLHALVPLLIQTRVYRGQARSRIHVDQCLGWEAVAPVEKVSSQYLIVMMPPIVPVS